MYGDTLKRAVNRSISDLSQLEQPITIQSVAHEIGLYSDDKTAFRLFHRRVKDYLNALARQGVLSVSKEIKGNTLINVYAVTQTCEIITFKLKSHAG